MITVITKERVLDYYYNFYLENLKLLNKNLSYKFLTLSEMYSSNKIDYNVNGDLFLINLNSQTLGQDILLNGMFWPFFVSYQQDKYFILEGKHRFDSLSLLHEAQEKQFLCFILPEDLDSLRDIIDDNYYYAFDNNNQKSFNNLYDAYIGFLQSSMRLSNLIYKTNNKYPKYIQPNPILNSNILFNQHFIKN